MAGLAHYMDKGGVAPATVAIAAAVGVGVWTTAGLPTWSAGVGYGRNGVHAIYGVTRGGVTTWVCMPLEVVLAELGSLGPLLSTFRHAFLLLKGFRVLFPVGMLAGDYAYNCVAAAASSLVRGWFGW